MIAVKGAAVRIAVLLAVLGAGGRAWSQDPASVPQTPAQPPSQTPAGEQQKPAAPAAVPAAVPADSTVPAAPAPPPDGAAAPPAAPEAAAPAAEQQPAAAPQTPATEPAAQAASPAQASTPVQTATPGPKPAVKVAGKKGKQVYTGPTTITELPPTPMLDDEGKQRLDPDGKPMFNPPVKQARDKFGHPLFDANGKPVYQSAKDMGYDERGKKIHVPKEKKLKTIAVSISRGTLTVDGMIGKAALNYDISDFKYIYMYAPWIGTVVVSNVMFPGAKAQPNGFDEHTLTVQVEDHTFQLYSDKVLLGKKPAPAYVLVDRVFQLESKVPVMGYGETLKAPYNWPGAKENPVTKAALKPPPVPPNLRPAPLLAKCPPGQMRDPSKVVLPGQTGPPPPCVAITSVRQAAAVAAAKPAPAPDAAAPTAADPAAAVPSPAAEPAAATPAPAAQPVAPPASTTPPPTQ